MFYVTHNYITKQFNDNNEAREYIFAEMDKHGLSYKQVFNKTHNGVQVIVFQYYTLYMETYIIHETMDLRDRRL